MRCKRNARVLGTHYIHVNGRLVKLVHHITVVGCCFWIWHLHVISHCISALIAFFQHFNFQHLHVFVEYESKRIYGCCSGRTYLSFVEQWNLTLQGFRNLNQLMRNFPYFICSFKNPFPMIKNVVTFQYSCSWS